MELITFFEKFSFVSSCGVFGSDTISEEQFKELRAEKKTLMEQKRLNFLAPKMNFKDDLAEKNSNHAKKLVSL